MKTLALILVVCLAGVSVQGKPLEEVDEADLVNMLKGLLTKGQHSITTRGKGDGKGKAMSNEASVESGESGEENLAFESTMLAGLPISDFVKPKVLSKKDLQWIRSAVQSKDVEDLVNTLTKVGKDVEAIAKGFIETFSDTAITELDHIKPALEKFHADVIKPKDMDMEGLKEWAEGLIIRAVLSGTDIKELNDVEGKNLNERGCEKKGNDGCNLGCILGKMKFLVIATETRQMMTLGALYDEKNGEPMPFCDSVFKLAENAAKDPSVFTGANVAKALVALGQCFINNAAMIETRINLDAVDDKDKPVIPDIPIPRLLAINSKMEIYEMQGWAGYMSFMVLEHIFQAIEKSEGANPATMPEPPAKKELLSEIQKLVDDIRAKSARNSRF